MAQLYAKCAQFEDVFVETLHVVILRPHKEYFRLDTMHIAAATESSAKLVLETNYRYGNKIQPRN